MGLALRAWWVDGMGWWHQQRLRCKVALLFAAACAGQESAERNARLAGLKQELAAQAAGLAAEEAAGEP